MTRVARMYYEQDMRQSDIAKQLDLSQATISRLFNRAKQEGIVRISVNAPPGVYVELEEKLIETYGLREAIIADCPRVDNEELIMRDIGAAAAFYVETTVKPNEVIGLSSWSATLLALVDAMHRVTRKTDIQVVQILGGIGHPKAEVHAARLTSRLATLVNGADIYLPAPGIVGSEAALQVLVDDPYVREALDLFDDVTMALVGIGSVEPSKLLAESGNIFSVEELDLLREKGAVGDVLLHFFDAEGNQLETFLDNRVTSMNLSQLRQVDRAIGVAGGSRKFKAIRGALRGGWINILVTDCATAERLVKEP